MRRGLFVVAFAGLLTAPAPSVSALQVGEPVRGDRVPVLLVPGWSDDAGEVEPLRRRLVAAGWDPADVLAVTFEDPVGSNRVHAREVARAIEHLRSRTGSEWIDIVAHSMGGLAVRYHLQHGGGSGVRRVAFVATPHRGTLSAHLVWGEGAEEMNPGSLFLAGLERGPPVPPGIEALTVRTPVDLHIVPSESATLLGVPDVEICCPTHVGLLDDDEAFRALEHFLVGSR